MHRYTTQSAGIIGSRRQNSDTSVGSNNSTFRSIHNSYVAATPTMTTKVNTTPSLYDPRSARQNSAHHSSVNDPSSFNCTSSPTTSLTQLVETELFEWSRCHEDAGRCLEQGQHAETIQLCTSRIESSLKNLVTVLQMNPYYAETLALRLSLPSLGVYALRGCARTHTGDYIGAVHDLTHVLSESQTIAKKTDIIALNLRSYALLELQRFTEASEDIRLALSLEPRNLDTRALQAMLLCSSAPHEALVLPEGARSEQRSTPLRIAQQIIAEVLSEAPDHWLAKTVFEYIEAALRTSLRAHSPENQDQPLPTESDPDAVLDDTLTNTQSEQTKPIAEPTITTHSDTDTIVASVGDSSAADHSANTLYSLLFHAAASSTQDTVATVESEVSHDQSEVTSNTFDEHAVSKSAPLLSSSSSNHDRMFSDLIQRLRTRVVGETSRMLESTFSGGISGSTLLTATPSKSTKHLELGNRAFLPPGPSHMGSTTKAKSPTRSVKSSSSNVLLGQRERSTLTMLDSVAPTLGSKHLFKALVQHGRTPAHIARDFQPLHQTPSSRLEIVAATPSNYRPSPATHGGTIPPVTLDMIAAQYGLVSTPQACGPRASFSTVSPRSQSHIPNENYDQAQARTLYSSPRRSIKMRPITLESQRTTGRAASGHLMKTTKNRAAVSAANFNKASQPEQLVISKDHSTSQLLGSVKSTSSTPILTDDTVTENLSPIPRPASQPSPGIIPSESSTRQAIPLYISSALGLSVSPTLELGSFVRLQTQQLGPQRSLLQSLPNPGSSFASSHSSKIMPDSATPSNLESSGLDVTKTGIPRVSEEGLQVIDDQAPASIQEALTRVQKNIGMQHQQQSHQTQPELSRRPPTTTHSKFKKSPQMRYSPNLQMKPSIDDARSTNSTLLDGSSRFTSELDMPDTPIATETSCDSMSILPGGVVVDTHASTSSTSSNAGLLSVLRADTIKSSPSTKHNILPRLIPSNTLSQPEPGTTQRDVLSVAQPAPSDIPLHRDQLVNAAIRGWNSTKRNPADIVPARLPKIHSTPNPGSSPKALVRPSSLQLRGTCLYTPTTPTSTNHVTKPLSEEKSYLVGISLSPKPRRRSEASADPYLHQTALRASQGSNFTLPSNPIPRSKLGFNKHLRRAVTDHRPTPNSVCPEQLHELLTFRPVARLQPVDAPAHTPHPMNTSMIDLDVLVPPVYEHERTGGGGGDDDDDE